MDPEFDSLMDLDEPIGDLVHPPVPPRRARQPPSNLRLEGRNNKMTKLGNTGIFYSDDHILGKGAYATVYAGFFQTPDRRAAIKRMSAEFAEIEDTERKIWLEVGSGPVTSENINVVQLISFVQFKDNDNTISYYFAMELADKTLEKALRDLRGTDEENWWQKCAKWLLETANGLAWLHKKRVIHRDIKPDNILIFSNGGKEIAKISDFGISRKISGLSGTGTNSRGIGAADWMAPETIEAMNAGDKVYTTKATDIFSFGMTCHYTLTKGEKHPFRKNSGRMQNCIMYNIQMAEIPPNDIPHRLEANHLCLWMMSQEFTNRPQSMEHIINHPFFWPETKKIHFVLEFCRKLYENTHELKYTRKRLDDFNRSLNPFFQWQSDSCFENCFLDLIFQRRGGTRSFSKYYGNSLYSLLKLIRDKHSHPDDIMDDLIMPEYFGILTEDGSFVFSESKYANYFLSRMDELVLVPFWFLVLGKDIYKDSSGRKKTVLGSVKQKYYINLYKNVSDLPAFSMKELTRIVSLKYPVRR